MKTTEKTLTEIYNLGNEATKEKLQKEFPSLFATKTELDKAIEKLGETDVEVVRLRKLENIENIDKILAFQKLVVVIKAINDGWIRKNEERFYYPWFYLDKFRFNHSLYCESYANSPASLCFKNEKDSTFCATNEEIFGYYKTYYS